VQRKTVLGANVCLIDLPLQVLMLEKLKVEMAARSWKVYKIISSR
jgi:hypothetical protein